MSPILQLTHSKCNYDSLPNTTPKLWLGIPAANHDQIFITACPIYAEWMISKVCE